MPLETDILVIGSGIAGLSFALLASSFARVLVATKKELIEAATNYAQGGLAAALAASDSAQAHVRDTLLAGDGLCDERVARRIVSDAPGFVRELEAWGARFTRAKAGGFDLGLEGGHSARRIVHAKDFTGREIERALVAAVRANRRIKILEDTLALDFILAKDPARVNGPDQNRCLGAALLKQREGKTVEVRSRCVVLASGGAGKIYFYTTNPEIATGDGMAMAYRAGCALHNLEFVQFHPTCLHHPKLRHFLISEAVRGEGAILRNVKGEAFMKRYDPRKELAPRDVVARSIDAEMKKTGDDCVYLDITHRSKSFIHKRFPNIYERLFSVGIDMAKDLVPVVPAAHYFCGGVASSISGRTALEGLWAIGEVACTGLHGANRLASNSLLEACAMARYAEEEIRQELADSLPSSRRASGFVPLKWGRQNLVGSDKNMLIAHNWDEVRRLMVNYVGIVRNEERLLRAARRLTMIEAEVEELAKSFQPTRDLAELVNITRLARCLVAGAGRRHESRGLHYMLDYPKKNPALIRPTIVSLQHPQAVIGKPREDSG